MTQELTDYSTFRHLHADKAYAYRMVMRAFVDARERFALHLKPQDVLEYVRADDATTAGLEDEKQVEQLLQQLVEWGNLNAHADNSEVKTVEDFNRPRFLYQFSRAGEAAERALAFFRENIEQPGELQATALADILREVIALRVLIESSPDDEKLYRTFRELFSRFEQLTSRAQQFIGSIQRVIDLQGTDLVTFLQYKEMLFDYLDRFIRELIVKGAQISEALLAISSDKLSAALMIAAERDLTDALDKSSQAYDRARSMWSKRWQGLNLWFIGDGRPSQLEQLRARARSAIPDLLAVVSSLNERRSSKSDRTADYRELARWFAQCQSTEEAHVLWRAAFCLSPARHLALTVESLDEAEEILVLPRTSWLHAPPTTPK